VKARTGAMVAGTAVLALALAACSSNSKSPTSKPAASGGFNAAVTSIVNPSTHKGGVLKLANNADFDSMDTAESYYAWVWNFSRYYSRTLVTASAAPGLAGDKLVNDLAANQTISSDGLTYTYTLKPGLKYEDGSTIKSEDIKYGIEREFAQDVITGGPTYFITFLDEGQKYPGPYKDKDPAGLKSITTPDDNTIVFKLAAPFADFPYLLAMPSAAPVPQSQDTGAKYRNHPFSSGPYKLQSYQPGKSAVFVRNTFWDPSTDPVRKALPDEIDLALGVDQNTIDSELINGTLDLDTAQVGVQSAAQAKILLDPNLKKNADEPNTGFIRYFAINTQVAPLDNIHCRNAVEYATDKVALQTARGGPDAGGSIAQGMLPPNIAGYDPNLTTFTGPSGQPDATKAKAELAACGQPNGFKTVIATTNTGKGPIVAQALQEALQKVGINATIDATDPANYYSATIGTPSNAKAKGYGLMSAGWGADFPTGYGFMDVIVDGTKIIPTGGNVDTAMLNDPQINQLCVQATAETDPTKAAADWAQINKLVMASATYLPYVYDKALNYRNPAMTNVFINGYYGMVDFSALGLSGS
jgi:peptide/nickel transport system substrate-binding protein